MWCDIRFALGRLLNKTVHSMSAVSVEPFYTSSNVCVVCCSGGGGGDGGGSRGGGDDCMCAYMRVCVCEREREILKGWISCEGRAAGAMLVCVNPPASIMHHVSLHWCVYSITVATAGEFI